jgi:hypothetical protein
MPPVRNTRMCTDPIMSVESDSRMPLHARVLPKSSTLLPIGSGRAYERAGIGR